MSAMLAGGCGFFLESVYCWYVPKMGISFRFLPVLDGLELDFNRWRVLPFFSTRLNNRISWEIKDVTYTTCMASKPAAPPSIRRS